MNFRFSALRVLLTYSQVNDLTKEDVLYTLQERYGIERYTLGEEIHADGGRHIHAVLVFSDKVDSRDVTLFDINDGTKVHHPNIKPIQRGKAHLERAEQYVIKEDPVPYQNWEPKLSWGDLLDRAATATEFFDLCRKNYPRDYIMNLQRLEYVARKHFPNCPNTIPEGWEPSYDHSVPGELSAWEETPNPFEKSLVIIGPPGVGKTTWAKSEAPKPALFIRHLDSLAKLRPEHKTIIFDDMTFNHLPPATQKYLVDKDNYSEIHIRYRVAAIAPGVNRIFTVNTYPFTDDGVDGLAIDRRIKRIYL